MYGQAAQKKDMKRILTFITAAAICVSALSSCSEKTGEGKDGFVSSPSVISGLFCEYEKSVSKNLLTPSSDAAATSEVEYTYDTPDGPETGYAPLEVGYGAETSAFSVRLGGHVYTYGKGFALDGISVRSVTDGDKIQHVIDTFIRAFCADTDDGDYETAPDSIRATETDVEVNRITLKVKKAGYAAMFDRAIDALEADKEASLYMKDALGFYGYMHGLDQSADELFSAFTGKARDALKNGGDELVWQRYVRGGTVVAARMKSGGNVIRYICAQTDDYTELQLQITLGEEELSFMYEARRTGMSDSYNIRMSRGDEITYFDGSAESAYKSGRIVFDLRASKNEKTVNGFQLQLDFNGVSKLKYSGGGNVVKRGEKTIYSYDMTFENTSDPPVSSPPTEDEALYEAVRGAFDQELRIQN